jgi:rRNA maturation protein Nop10
MTPKKGEIMVTSGLFSPPFAKKPVRFVKEVKKRGEHTWEAELLEPICGETTLIAHPLGFFHRGEKIPDEFKELFNQYGDVVIETCCDKHTTKFCPECGKRIGE